MCFYDILGANIVRNTEESKEFINLHTTSHSRQAIIIK